MIFFEVIKRFGRPSLTRLAASCYELAMTYKHAALWMGILQATLGMADAPPPNVLILFVDDLNAALEGMDGHPNALTPNLERLAQRGVRFMNAASNVPICGPSRASVWSGLYPHTSGLFAQGPAWGHWRENPVQKDSVTLFEHFRAQGYHLYTAGKVHHNGEEDYSIFENMDGSEGFAVRAAFGPMIRDEKQRHVARASIQVGGESHWDVDFGPLMAHPPVPNGTGTWEVLDEPFRYVTESDRDLLPDERAALQCVEWLQTYDGSKPFLMTLGLIRPHAPLVLPPSYFERFPLDQIQIAPARIEGDDQDTGLVRVEGLRGGVKWGRTKFNAIMNAGGEPMLKQWTQAYLAAVSFMDDRVGEVLDALEASPFAQNTIIIFSSDHGYHMGDKDLLHKFTPWESSLRIPLIIAGPGIVAGVQCDSPVSLIDLFPTLNALAGIPNDPNRHGNHLPLDGHSLVPLLTAPQAGKWEGPDVSLSVIAGKIPPHPGTTADKTMQHYSLRSTTHRYIRWNDGQEELYDHRVDPWEWKNLADTPDSEEQRAWFRKRWSALTGIR